MADEGNKVFCSQHVLSVFDAVDSSRPTALEWRLLAASARSRHSAAENLCPLIRRNRTFPP